MHADPTEAVKKVLSTCSISLLSARKAIVLALKMQMIKPFKDSLEHYAIKPGLPEPDIRSIQAETSSELEKLGIRILPDDIALNLSALKKVKPDRRVAFSMVEIILEHFNNLIDDYIPGIDDDSVPTELVTKFLDILKAIYSGPTFKAPLPFAKTSLKNRLERHHEELKTNKAFVDSGIKKLHEVLASRETGRDPFRTIENAVQSQYYTEIARYILRNKLESVKEFLPVELPESIKTFILDRPTLNADRIIRELTKEIYRDPANASLFELNSQRVVAEYTFREVGVTSLFPKPDSSSPAAKTPGSAHRRSVTFAGAGGSRESIVTGSTISFE
ncbi:MAG: hypothetical protein Q7V63_04495 [Gammaproteobacteria bacterium]|nr:hypothetical protein [Gammaproteobacteria bacterium]